MKTLKRIGRIFLIVAAILLIAALVVPFLVPVPPLDDTVPPQQLADSDSRYINIDGIDIHYKLYGQEEPALLLLHGFPSNLFTWREVNPTLSEQYQVVSYDRPAFGLTDRPLEWQDDNPYSSSYQPQLALKLLDQLGIEQAVLVGNSAGGRIATEIALEHPERVNALILVSPAIYGEGRPSLQQLFLLTPQGKHLGVLLVRQIQEWGLELGKAAWHDPSKLTPEIWDGYTKPLKADNWDRALLEFVLSGRSDSKISERLQELTMPVLVITGDDDRIVPTSDSVRLASELPNAKLVIIPNCGHVPQEECPVEFSQAVKDFLSQIPIQIETLS